MSKQDLIEQLREARADFMAAVEGLDEGAMLRPGVAGIWSIKDMMAHLVAWEAELVTALSRKLAKPYSAAPNLATIEDIDEWNDEQYHLNAAKPLAIILPDFHGVHKHLIAAIEDLDAKVLDQPGRFDWMEGEPLAYLVLENAVWHEQEHAEAIRDWRAEQGL